MKTGIEEDLLDISSPDIKQLVLSDYNLDLPQIQLPGGVVGVGRPRLEERMMMTVAWDSADSKWDLRELLERRSGRLVPSPLLEGEELSKEKLDDLKTAVDDLKIIGVESKPEELVSGSKSDQDLLNDPKIGPSLMEKGFYPLTRAGVPMLLSSNGEGPRPHR